MIYDLSNPLHAESFKVKANAAYRKQAVVELTLKTRRTKQQNSYLHLILGYVAKKLGETMEYVKNQYFKRTCNAEIFMRRQYDELCACEVERLRSTRDLSTEELSVAIDRFKNFMLQKADIYIPDADNRKCIDSIEAEVSRYERYL